MSRVFKNSPLFVDLFLLFIVSLIPLIWIGPGQYVTGNDAAYPINIQSTYLNRFFAWTHVDSLGQETSMHFGSLFIHTVLAFGSYLGLSITDAQRLTFIFWFFAILLSIYLFARSINKLFPYRYFPLIAAFFYGINYFLLELWKLGAATTFSVYVALPLFMKYILPILEGHGSILPSAISIALITVFFNGGLGFSSPLYGGVILTVATAIIFYLIFCPRPFVFRYISRVIAFFILSGMFVLTINGYAFIPFINYLLSNYSVQVDSHGGVEGVISWAREVSKHTSISNLFRLQGYPDWYEVGVGPDYARQILNNPFFIALSMSIAPLAYASLLLYQNIKQRKFILYLAILSLVAILFSAGTHPPTGWLYVQFVKYIPGFAIFRSAQYKFIPALFFSVSLLLSYTLNILFARLQERNIRNSSVKLVLSTLFPMLILGLILAYHYPIFGKSNFIWRAPMTTLIQIPKYVTNYDDLLAQINIPSRILLTPKLNSVWGSEAYTWGYTSVSSLFNTLHPTSFISNSYLLNDQARILITRLYKELLSDGSLVDPLARIFNISHILVRGDSYYQLDWIRSENPLLYIEALKRYKNISKIWSDSMWTLYRFDDDSDKKFYKTNTIAKVSGDREHILGPLLLGTANFIYQNGSEKNELLEKSSLNMKSIEGARCDTCALDESMNTVDRSFSRILPGSWFYPLKMRKEAAELGSASEDKILTVNLGHSLNRINEMEQLRDMKESESLINETVDRLFLNWQQIDQYSRSQNIENNITLIKLLETYANREKDVIENSITSISNVQTRDKLSNIVKITENISNLANRSRLRAFDIKGYTYNGKYSANEVYIDKETLAKDALGNLVYPINIFINNKKYPVNPIDMTDTIYLGRFNFDDANSFDLEFPPQRDLLSNGITHNAVIDNELKYCLSFSVNQYNWQKNYRLTIFDPLLISPKSQVIVSYQKFEPVDPVMRTTLRKDKLFMITHSNRKSQLNYFAGEESSEAATVSLCADNNGELMTNKRNFSLHEVYKPSVYINHPYEKKSADIENTVLYKKISPVMYEISLGDDRDDVLVIFNENFNSNWKMYSASSKPLNYITKFFYPLFHRQIYEKNHIKINGFANAWLLPAGHEQRVIVFFYPQYLFGVGIIISLISAFVILIISLSLKYK
ncbi:MAG: hypothetical protein ACOY3M_04900 [Patescibacteria group bacterium]